MSRRKEALDRLFDCFVKEGRPLGVMETKRLYPTILGNLKKVSIDTDVRRIFNRMRKIYAHRWHEIYDKGVVHVKPEEASKPAKSPLEALKAATRKVNE